MFCIFITLLLGFCLVFPQGCYEKVKSELKNNFIALGIAGIVLGILQIINLVISMVLICAIRRSRNVAV